MHFVKYNWFLLHYFFFPLEIHIISGLMHALISKSYKNFKKEDNNRNVNVLLSINISLNNLLVEY